MEKVKVLIAEDHTLVREGLCKILSLEEKIKIEGEAANGEQAVNLAFTLKPDVILMDINMPVLNGIEATKMIKSRCPGIAVIALTIHDHEEYLFEMIKAGASGYVLKDISPGLLVKTILGAARGESFIHPSMTGKMLAEFTRLAAASERTAGPMGLTRRELEVLRLVARGDNNRSIAGKLYISEKTVKNHLTSIFQKMGVTDRTQAVIQAVKLKLLEL
ncbi:MAG: response regulator transcription factor [Firmicutes bacterium]|nr:response regulator transcription factor [Bacillota bacterium]